MEMSDKDEKMKILEAIKNAETFNAQQLEALGKILSRIKLKKEQDTMAEIVGGTMQLPVKPPADKPVRITNQLLYMQKVLKKLTKHRYAWIISSPIDPVRLGIPDYYEKVRNPLDLEILKKRLKNQYYWSASECIDDVNTVFANCYNSNDITIMHMVKTLKEIFVSQLSEMPKDEFVMSKTNPSLLALMENVALISN